MFASIVAAAQKDVVVIDEVHQKILGAKIIKAAPYALPNTKKITVENTIIFICTQKHQIIHLIQTT
jgi:hypothetical protein